MGAKTDSQLMAADQRRQRGQARAERRRADRALVPVVAAQQLGITVAVLADARRAGGVSTATRAQRWASDPETAPPWLMRLLGERMAAAAQATYALESGQWPSGWFDVAALQPCEAGSG